MGFFRRKSHGPVEENVAGDGESKKSRESRVLQKQQQQRNRLSKPKTNRSSTNLQMIMSQEAGVSENNLVTSEQEQEIPQPPVNESREVLRSRIFGPDAENAPTAAVPTIPNSKNASVASLVNKFENNPAAASASQLSLTSLSKPNRPFSGMFGSRRSSGVKRGSLASRSSRELLKAGETRDITPSPSRDQLAEDYAPRPRREASFTPGVATRTTSGNDSSIEEEPEIQTPSTQQEEFIEAKEDIYEEPDDWLPPPHTYRAGTPADLDYTHLGGLRLGSLHVVNGRASPAMSELPRHVRDRLLLRPRDSSSQYGDSDDGTAATEQWEDAEVIDEESGHQRKPSRSIHQNQNRQFSFEFGEDKKLNMTEKLQALDPIVTSPPQTPKARDRTSVLADSYIAELPLSPYAPSPPDSDAGSVRHHEDRKGGRSFEDRALNRSPERRSESAVSWYSPVEPVFQQEEAFSSAVEIQPAPSNEYLRPDMPVRSSNKSDSGYSSNTSLSNTSRKYEDAVVYQHTEIRSPDVVVRQEFRMSPRRQQQQPTPASPSTIETASTIKPSTAKIETLTSIPIADVTIADITNASDSLPPPTPVQTTHSPFVQTPTSADRPTTSASSITRTEQSSLSQSKIRKKLQKTRRKSTAEVAKELVVQRVASTESHTLPPVTSDAESNLAMRSEVMPELQKTHQTHNTVKNQASLSVLSFFVPDIRFPSPAPETQQDSKHSSLFLRSGKKDRPKSRPRTWFGKPKDSSKEDKRISMINSHGVSSGIRDLGDVVDSLGTNPYDIANIGPRPHTNHADVHPLRSSPHNISSQVPRPKSMMDDRTAIHFSKLRSRSIQEKESMESRRSSFNDRGGIPGKNFRLASTTSEAPPLPPMPDREEIERRFSNRQSSYMSYLGTPNREKQYWVDPISSEPDSSPAPPPPAHSTLPMYSHQDEYEFEEEDAEEFAPPPPSHSPRPRDITPEPQSLQSDMWAEQAEAWRARRESAGNILRRSWDEQQHEQHGYYQEEPKRAPVEEPLYPDIPLRNGSQWQPKATPNPAPNGHTAEIWADREYQSALREYFGNEEPAQVPSRPLPNPQQSRTSFHSRSLYSQEERHRSRSRSPYRPRSRPQSAHSFASSLAEELHPADLKRTSPAPDYGRYSGGLEYGYEGRDKGFGGSAGTRSVSGKADAKRRSGASMNTYGLDFSDIPAMGVPMGAVGVKFKYENHD